MYAADLVAVPSRLAISRRATSSAVPRMLLVLFSAVPSAMALQLARALSVPWLRASVVSQVRTLAAAGFRPSVVRASSAQVAAFFASDNVYYVYFKGSGAAPNWPPTTN